jgi:hypothetical protein
MAGEVEKPGMKAVSTAAVAVPLQHDSAHIVVQNLARGAAECQKGVLVRLDQRLNPLVGDELDIGGPAPAQRRHESREPVAAAPNDRPVDLHLLAWAGLEPDHRLDCLLRPQRRGEQLQHRVAAAIAALAQLHQQHTRRYPLRRRRGQPLGDVDLERSELGRPSRTRLVARRLLVAQIAPHRVARHTRFPRDLADALAVPMQYPNLQSRLHSHHPAPLQFEGTSLASGSAFSRRPGSELQRR